MKKGGRIAESGGLRNGESGIWNREQRMPVATSGVGLVEWEFGRWGLEQDIDLRDPDDGGCVACSFAKGSAGQVRRPETPTHPLVMKHNPWRGGRVACDARERSRVLRGIEPRIGSEKCGFRNIGGEQSLTRRVRRFLLRQGFGGTRRRPETVHGSPRYRAQDRPI